ncbi:MAG: M12 family metallo-peptidase, partial [Polyangiaceae bacterium]|nr:M12 family metallo-peptidase [Polyangiaceae bacterium]
SQWGQREAEQRRNAMRDTPASIAASTNASAPTPALRRHASVHTFRIRVVATPAYQAQILSWQQDLQAIIDQANEILEPELGARLQVVSVHTWHPSVSEQSLSELRQALIAMDSGEDVDWVVGLAGSVPTATDRFDQIGQASMLGKHWVQRAATRLGEHDAVEQSFDELKDTERAALMRKRKKHRAVAVFLHELGHTLGGLHERDEHSLMHARYDPRMTSFGEQDTELMRISLAHRAKAQDARAQASLARELLATLEPLPADRWEPKEKEHMLAYLRGLATHEAPKPPASAAAVSSAQAQVWGGAPVPAEQQQEIARISELVRARKLREAWTAIRP